MKKLKNSRLKKRTITKKPAKRRAAVKPAPSYYMLIDEVCQYFRIAEPSTIWRWRRRYPEFPKPFKIGRTVRWLRGDIEEFGRTVRR
jgi:predicted DNA-binding transcriptional regulator AlpA